MNDDLVQLGDLVAGTRRVTVSIPEVKGSIHLKYRIGLITHGSVRGNVVDLLASWVEEWDLMDGDVPVPLTPEGVAKVPQYAVVSIFDAIVEDVRERPTGTSGSMSAG